MRPSSATRLRRAVPGGLVAALLGASAAGLISCGDTTGLIASSDSSQLQQKLDDVSSAVSDNDCRKAASAVAAYQREVANLPRSVDPQLKQRLAQGGRTLATRAAKDCQKKTETVPTQTQTTPTVAPPPVTTPTAPTPTQPTPTQTTPTQTTPTETTPTETTPTTPTTPDDGGGKGDKGKGKGNGGGNGGAGTGDTGTGNGNGNGNGNAGGGGASAGAVTAGQPVGEDAQ